MMGITTPVLHMANPSFSLVNGTFPNVPSPYYDHEQFEIEKQQCIPCVDVEVGR